MTDILSFYRLLILNLIRIASDVHEIAQTHYYKRVSRIRDIEVETTSLSLYI